jgi:hypothetical protein
VDLGVPRELSEGGGGAASRDGRVRCCNDLGAIHSPVEYSALAALVGAKSPYLRMRGRAPPGAPRESCRLL